MKALNVLTAVVVVAMFVTVVGATIAKSMGVQVPNEVAIASVFLTLGSAWLLPAAIFASEKKRGAK